MSWEVVVLGIAQDGGVPHPGCACPRCAAARDGSAPRLRVACLGLTDGERSWLFDATPDLPDQMHALGGQLTGLFLTHAHMGHVAGLLYLGREALAANALDLYATDSMRAFVEGNAPWAALATQGRVQFAAPDDVDLGGVRVTSFPVPHRAEHTDTVGYRIDGPAKSVVFIPDIDSWHAWERDVRDVVAGADVSFLDATFYAPDELPGRDISEIRHPLVVDTMERLDGLGDRVRLIHLNHSNRLLMDAADAERAGFQLAVEGERIAL